MPTRLGGEFRVNTTNSPGGGQRNSSVTGLSDGRFVVSFDDLVSGGSNVYFRIFNADGSPVGPDSIANTTTTGAQGLSSLTKLGAGFVVTWQDFSQTGGDTSQFAIRAQMFDASGSKVGAEFLVNTTTFGGQTNPKVVELAGGRFVIGWENPTTERDVVGQVFEANGTRVGGEFSINTVTTGAQDNLSLAALADGGFVATWTDNSNSPDDSSNFSVNLAVRGQKFDASGAKVGSAFLVNTTTENDQWLGDVHASPDGGFIVVFRHDFEGTGPGYGIKLQSFDAQGQRRGGEIDITPPSLSFVTLPDIVVLPNGGYVVVWDATYTTGPDTSSSSVWIEEFTAQGASIGGPAIVNTSTANRQLGADIALLANGDVVVTWDDFSNTNSTNIIIAAQRFSTAASVQGPSEGNDTLNGTPDPDTINGLGGNDIINGLAGNDTLDGGEGNDAIAAGLGNDTVHGGAGNDVISGDGGSDVLHGDDGDDTFLFAVGEPGGSTQAYGGAGTDTVILRGGGASIDLTTNGGSAGAVAISVNSIENVQFDGSVDAGGGARLAYGSAGANAIVALGILAPVTFEGRGGDDLLVGGDGADSLLGGDGNDNVSGADGNDTIEGGSGADHLAGGLGADWIYGGTGNDVISGDGGSDILLGEDGDDAFLFAVGEPGGSTQAYGGAGTDTVILRGGGASIDLTTNGGSAGAVAISVNSIENVQFDGSVDAGGGARLAYGSAGANAIVALGILAPVTFEGRGGDDLLVGGDGADSLLGGDDNDIIKGNGGDDAIDGGLGTDLVELRGLAADYVITAVSGGYRVTDAVTGRDGSDLLSGVETLRFGDGTTMALTPAAAIMPEVLPALVEDKAAGPQVLPGAHDSNAPEVLPAVDDSFVLTGKFDLPPVLPPMDEVESRTEMEQAREMMMALARENWLSSFDDNLTLLDDGLGIAAPSRGDGWE